MPKYLRSQTFEPSRYDAAQRYSTSNYYNKSSQTEPQTWDQLVIQPLEEVAMNVVKFLPDLITATFTLAIGWMVAKVSEFIISKFLKNIGFDKIAETVGITGLLESNDKKIAAHAWVGKLVFWLIMFFSVISSLGHLNLNLASRRMDDFFYFLTTILITLIIFLLGLFLSFITSKIVQTTSERLKVPNPTLYANITRWTILTFTFLMCLTQIGLPPQVILVVLGATYLTLCITFIIAFGTGGISFATKVLDKVLDKKT